MIKKADTETKEPKNSSTFWKVLCVKKVIKQ